MDRQFQIDDFRTAPSFQDLLTSDFDDPGVWRTAHHFGNTLVKLWMAGN